MNSIMAQIKELANSSDTFGRAEIQDTLRELQYSLETPFETVMRMSLDTCQVAVSRLAADMGLFTYLVQCSTPQSADALAEHFAAGKDLMTRLLRYMSSVGMVQETSDVKYTVTNITRSLAIPGYEAGIRHAFDNLWPVLMALPDFAAERRYKDIVDGNDTVFQKAFNSNEHCFHWMAHQQDRLHTLKNIMTAERLPNFLSTFPWEKELGLWSDPERAVFVDMGGGLGQACTRLREMYPHHPGRLVLQDLPPLIINAKPLNGVDMMVHDMLTPQPLKGAKFYFIRAVLRDYSDRQCTRILENIVPSMHIDSRVVIDDVVAKERGARWQETGTDICIMAALGSRERTQKQWEDLAAQVGLDLVAVYPYTRPVVNAAMVFSLKQ